MEWNGTPLPAFVQYKPSRSIKKEWLGKTRWFTLYQHYYWKIYELMCSMFIWENTPLTMDTTVLEQDLIFNGCAVVLKDDVTGEIINLRGTGSNLDIYGRYTYVTAFGRNGKYRRDGLRNYTDCVMFYNNKLRTPMLDLVQIYSADLAEIHHAIEINIKQQKTPITILGSKSQVDTMRKMYEIYDTGYPVLIEDKASVTGIETKLLMTDVPLKAKDLEELKRSIWSEVLTLAGINNVNFEKSERLVTGEVHANNEMIYIMRDYMLQARKEGCRYINALYGTHINVRYAYDVGGGKNESIYARTPMDINERTGITGNDEL